MKCFGRSRKYKCQWQTSDANTVCLMAWEIALILCSHVWLREEAVAFIKWWESSPCGFTANTLKAWNCVKKRIVSLLYPLCVAAIAPGTAEGRFETCRTHKAWLSWNAIPPTQHDISHLSLLIVSKSFLYFFSWNLFDCFLDRLNSVSWVFCVVQHIETGKSKQNKTR